ncbi:DNA-binding protein [Pseudonocardia sp. H11422]|uniref:DNA-binding protein n=1 Tax=Pseudonocardia sp. H11422 TaxID=2835866 RepID=UPI001BDC9C43|nr:DNA-binding protein [Pseudonocardia sp. H11422]
MTELLDRARTAADAIAAPTLDEIRAWPATVDIPRACTPFGISRSFGYELAARGEFPARVIKVGGRLRVVTASIVAALESP